MDINGVWIAPNGGIFQLPASTPICMAQITWPTIQQVARNLTVEQSLQPALVEFPSLCVSRTGTVKRINSSDG